MPDQSQPAVSELVDAGDCQCSADFRSRDVLDVLGGDDLELMLFIADEVMVVFWRLSQCRAVMPAEASRLTGIVLDAGQDLFCRF